MLILWIYFNKEAFCYGKCYTFWHRNTSLVLIERNPDTLLPGRGVTCPNGAGIPRLAGQCPLLPAQSQPGSSARWWPQRCSDPRGSCALRAPLLPTHHGGARGEQRGPAGPAPRRALNAPVTASAKERLGKGSAAASKPSAKLQLHVQHLQFLDCVSKQFSTLSKLNWAQISSLLPSENKKNAQITYPLINSIFLCLISQFLLLAQPIIPPFSTQLLPFSFKAASHFLHSITMQ